MVFKWHIEIQETAQLVQRGIPIFVFTDGKRKIYCKPIKNGEQIEWQPLDKIQLKEFGVEVEESYTSDIDPDFEVQESESEPEKKKTTYNIDDPEDMKRAQKMAEEQLARLQQEDPEKWKLQKDNKTKTREELEQELENAQSKIELIATVALEKKMDNLGIPQNERAEFREHPEQLFGYEKGMRDSRKESIGAPLNEQQLGIRSELTKRQFETPLQMVRYLRERAKKDPLARQVLDLMFIKGLKGNDRSGESQGMTLKDIKELRKKKVD